MTYNKTIILVFFTLGAVFASNAQVARTLESSDNKGQAHENQAHLRDRYQELVNQMNDPKNDTTHFYEGEHLSAIQFPVGGIGGGCIQFDGAARARFWQIFNNMAHDALDNSFMLIRIQSEDGVQVRALQTQDVGAIKGMAAVRVKSEFPFIDYIFEDELPVNVTLRVFNPFIPLNLDDSSIPSAMYQVIVDNTSSKEVDVRILASQLNGVGLSKAGKPTEGDSFAEGFANSLARKLMQGNGGEYFQGNFNHIEKSKNAAMVVMESTIPNTDEHFGAMALMVIDDDKKLLKNTQLTAHWDDQKQLLEQFSQNGTIEVIESTQPSPQGSTYSAALSTGTRVKASSSREFNLALSWYFPNGKNGGYNGEKWDAWGGGRWEGDGNYYASIFSSIDELNAYISANWDRLLGQSRDFQQTLYQSSLPYWLTERLSSQLSILRSRTIFHDKNGYVGLWEGAGSVDGSCSGNCNHVWHYAQAHARLFPALARSTREQGYRMIKENGQIPYRQPSGSHAFDGQCGDILSTYREHLLSPNSDWLKGQYGAVRKAINYLIETWDANGDGWLEGNMHTTYDCGMSGNASFLTSLYLATLKAGVEMAKVCDDPQSASLWQSLFEISTKMQDQRLWNGEYYIQVPDTLHRANDYEGGCHTDQLLGQWWADQLNLGDILPRERVDSAFNSVFRYNYKSTLEYHKQAPRSFALRTEPGIIVTTWPKDSRPQGAPGYSDEVWPSHEYTIASSLIERGELEKALVLLYGGALRYDGRKREGFTDAWGNFGFTGNPFGDDECGQFYSRSLANWSVLLSLQGFQYDGPRGAIGFLPNWSEEDHRSFFSTAQGWGLFSQKIQASEQSNSLQIKWGSVELKEFLVPQLSGAQSYDLILNNQTIKFKHTTQGEQLVIYPNEALELTEGDILEIKQRK